MGKPVATVILRGLAGLSYLVAAIVLLKCKQEIHHESMEFVITYYDWSGLMFCVFVNFIASGHNLLILLCIPDGDAIWRRVALSDVIMNILVGTTLGAGWLTFVLILEGNINVSWEPICGVTSFFCRKVLGSLVTTTFGFVIGIGLLMWSLIVGLIDE